MTDPNWERLMDLVDEARKLPPTQWGAFVVREAEDDPPLAREILETLASEPSRDFISPPERLADLLPGSPPLTPRPQAGQGSDA